MSLTLVFILAVFMACKDQWEDHNALKKNVLSENLDQLIAGNSSLSVFAGYLKQTGYDKILASSKTFTVWAPDNNALNSLDTSIVNHIDKLTQFIGNHISYQEYTVNSGAPSVKIKMLSGKNIQYLGGGSMGGAEIALENSNQYCLNGILHVIKSPLYPKKSVWEYLSGITDTTLSIQKDYLQTTLVERVFDPNLSTLTGYNSKGQPVYDSVWVNRNAFLYYLNDVSNEDSVYTFFVLKNDASRNEYSKLLPYVKDTTADSAYYTDFYAKLNIYKDVVVRGKYTGDKLPFNLISTQGIAIPAANITIESQYEASNGMVYVVSNFDIPKENKISTIVIEGENYADTYNGSFVHQTIPLLGIRSRSWASGGRDLYIPGSNGPGITNLSVMYNTPYLYSVHYLVFWRAVNDFQSGNFVQKLAINANSMVDITDTTNTVVKFKTIVPNDYSEEPLGTFTVQQYSKFRLFVVAGKVTNNPIVLDYLKLVPIFQ